MKIIKYILLLFSTLALAQETTQEFAVYFDTDSSLLSSVAQEKIETTIQLQDSAVISHISITGTCDDRGGTDYNKKLAHRRVSSVMKYLKPRFNYDTISELALGEIPLTSTLNINEQRAQNRRVDVVITFQKVGEIVIAPPPVIKDTIERYRSYDILKDSLQVGDKLVFNNVIFYPGRHVLRESSFPVMDSIINSLLLHKKYEIEIQGHICCLAAGIYGRDMDTGQWNLSQARADQVKKFLVKYGVAADRLTTVGKQSNFKTGKGDYYDRRVEIHITGIREEEVKK